MLCTEDDPNNSLLESQEKNNLQFIGGSDEASSQDGDEDSQERISLDEEDESNDGRSIRDDESIGVP